ncbi:DUF502 domain-containing protein [Pseudomaricurvus alkylphenolicus]|uniref:DUF502 domain-containing protein n=1 Tax=Pseudomaricurvus alkylphenolicus TaxID=1306991 RepID=UPI00142303B6|nr:DUF502 domain-containing protein [Pseudomaricurvus alkylphenolicus]NIB44377.1 DUF502 domain-containing protein [Pseudomaricurvus alkylphenolicus]
MGKLRSFIALTFLGGITVVLPIAILMILFQWLFALVTDFIQPLTDLLTSRSEMRELLADGLVLILLLGLCFSVGLLIKTGVGRWLHYWLDKGLARFAPGYSTIRDIVVQFIGGSEATSLLAGEVALVKLYGEDSELQVTGIVTARHGDRVTVFVPTAPVPTSGMVYHVPENCVTLLPDISVEQAMKTVIACGAGSQTLLGGA